MGEPLRLADTRDEAFSRSAGRYLYCYPSLPGGNFSRLSVRSLTFSIAAPSWRIWRFTEITRRQAVQNRRTGSSLLDRIAWIRKRSQRLLARVTFTGFSW